MSKRKDDERSRISLHDRERSLTINRLPPTFTSVEDAMRMAGLPEDVFGLTIVDLASGGSPFVTGLLSRFANAYGVDARYESFSGFITEAETSLQMIAGLNIKQNTPERIRKIKQDFLQFGESFLNNSERYIHGWLTAIPLPDDFADYVTSLTAISDMFEDYELFRTVTFEAIRIAKPGGSVIIAPFDSQASSHRRPATREILELTREIKRRKIGEVHYEDIQVNGASTEFKRLRIVKRKFAYLASEWYTSR